MIVVRVELWSAVTGRRTELARMQICNRPQHLAVQAARRRDAMETLELLETP